MSIASATAGTSVRSRVQPATYKVPDLAVMLGVSERQIWRMKDAGQLPPCIRVGRLVMWTRPVIDGWLAAGCPKPRSR